MELSETTWAKSSEKAEENQTLSVSIATSLIHSIVDLHYQQRTARKCLTIIQGLPDDLDYKKILRAYKKLFNCNGTIVEDEEMGTVIQLQGDKRKDVALFLLEEGIANREEIKIHGY